MHPQIKSIAVSDVKNETKEPNASAILRGNLTEQFQTDGSLKLKSLGQADCILYSRILEVKNSTARWDSHDDDKTFRPAEFKIEVLVEFTVIIPGTSEPLVKTRQVWGDSNYQYHADPAIGRKNGLRQACYNAARKVVQYTTEAW